MLGRSPTSKWPAKPIPKSIRRNDNMARTPIRSTSVRSDADAPAQTTKKTRLRKNASQRSVLDIPADILDGLKANGIDLQWVADSVLGQPSPATRNAFEINGWEPVTPDMWNHVFDGMWTRKGHTGEI